MKTKVQEMTKLDRQAESWIELTALCREAIGDEAFEQDGRWAYRCGMWPGAVERVMADVRQQQREGRKFNCAAAYAESLWKAWQ